MQHAALDSVFRALADPTRRAVFERLTQNGEASVGDLTAFAGVSQPAVSQHLKALRSAGLVEASVGPAATHTTAPKPITSRRWSIGSPAQDIFWRDRIGRLADLLKEID